MNERIREIAQQACFDEIGKDYSLYFNLTKDKVEKFAELIVEEMYDFMCKATDNDGAWPSFKEVKEHFGVEE